MHDKWPIFDERLIDEQRQSIDYELDINIEGAREKYHTELM